MKKVLLLIGVMMLTVSASAQKLWTLQECIDYAMENNITLQKSKLQKSTATETLEGYGDGLCQQRYGEHEGG